MSLPRLEPFTVANGQFIQVQPPTYTPAIPGWAYLPNVGGWLTAFAISSNQIYNSNASVGTAAVDTLNTYNNDQYAQIVYKNTGTGYIGVAVRCDTADLNGTVSAAHKQCYLFECTAGDRYFSKKVAGTETQLADDGGSPSVNDILRLEASGTTITAKINGTTIFTVTDSALSSGSAGIFAEGNDITSLGDNWEGGNLAGAAENQDWMGCAPRQRNRWINIGY